MTANKRPARAPAGVRRLHGDRRGAVTLEWVLILAVVALPMLGMFRLCLSVLVAKYRMMTFVNSMPFP